MVKRRVAILISGRGSNMMSLVAAARTPSYPAEIVHVISNRPAAPGLAWAAGKGIGTSALDHKTFPSRERFEDAVQARLADVGVELVCCAGFMRLMTPGFVERWRDRMLNIHPSLLPSYKGLNTHERALSDGVRISGCTVHFVRADMDSGPIIAQAAVAVASTDSVQSLADRVLSVEHQLYPHALALVASGAVSVVDERVICVAGATLPPPLFSPNLIT